MPQCCFCCWWEDFMQDQSFPVLCTSWLQGKLGEIQPGQLTPADERDILYYMTWGIVTKSGRKKEEGRTFGTVVFVFPSNHYLWWNLLSYFDFSRMCSFYFMYKNVFISIHKFYCFKLADSLPYLQQDNEQAVSVVLSGPPELNHNTISESSPEEPREWCLYECSKGETSLIKFSYVNLLNTLY